MIQWTDRLEELVHVLHIVVLNKIRCKVLLSYQIIHDIM